MDDLCPGKYADPVKLWLLNESQKYNVQISMNRERNAGCRGQDSHRLWVAVLWITERGQSWAVLCELSRWAPLNSARQCGVKPFKCCVLTAASSSFSVFQSILLKAKSGIGYADWVLVDAACHAYSITSVPL